MRSALPAGTFVDTTLSSFKRVGFRQHEGWATSAYQMTEPPMIRPIRMSPWAYPEQKDQSLYAVSDDSEGYDEKRADVIASVSLNYFHHVAKEILADCGLRQPS